MTTSKTYDNLNRLTDISSQPTAQSLQPIASALSYNAANQRTKNTLTDGSYWVYAYDSLGQVTNGCKYFPNGAPVPGQQFDYAFDTIGNRTQTETGGDTNGLNLRVANYHANSLNQLTNRDIPEYVDIMGASILTNTVTVNGQTAYRNQEYFRAQIPANNTNSALWTNIIVSGGQSVTGHVYVAQQPERFAYDADGNLTNDGRWSYTWDAENRLIGMTVNTNVGPQYQLNFAYDPQGRRIQKLVTTGGVPTYTNNFLYDGWNLVAEIGPNNSLIRYYVWGTDLSGSAQGAGGVGGLLEVSYHGAAATNAFVAYDGNGNVTALINAADGTLLANYDYGPFGEVIRATGPARGTNPIRFSTKFQDDESDLLYYGYRYYKASTGTWPSRDPLGERGGMNLYMLVGNNAINSVDSFGLVRWGELLKIGDGIDSVVRLIPCCCSKPTGIHVTIHGVPTGTQVTETANVTMYGCTDSIKILLYFWWDCGSAQREAATDPSCPPPTTADPNPWHDYGWHLGSNPQTQGELCTAWPVGPDPNDTRHWNWQSAVLFIACKSGHYRANLELSNAEEWTWSYWNHAWSDPHDGSGGK